MDPYISTICNYRWPHLTVANSVFFFFWRIGEVWGSKRIVQKFVFTGGKGIMETSSHQRTDQEMLCLGKLPCESC